jgi:hypothetical protein
MNIYIDKNVLGFQQHLVLSEDRKIHRVQEIPDTEILVYGDPELEEIAKVHGKTLPRFPSDSHRKALEAVLKDEKDQDVPWAMTMPPKAFKRSVEALADQLWEQFAGINLDYYLNHYKKTQPILGWMARAKIDPRAWMVHKNDPELITPHVFRSFEPDSFWMSERVCYSKSDTKTGRLKILQGPNILHLPKNQRNILGSRWGSEGRIMQLDFRALEPRVVLFINSLSPSLSGNPPRFGSGALGEDIYQEVLLNLGITDIHRDKVKDVILSQLYGAGYDKIVSGLEGVPDPDGFIGAVNEFFGLDQLRERLVQEYESNNREFILSFYGRYLDTREAKPYMLLNYFTQSTAVDVALYGFRNFLRATQGNEQIIPLFILHDALVLDVHNSALEHLNTLKLHCSRNIPLFPGCEFAIKVSRF